MEHVIICRASRVGELLSYVQPRLGMWNIG